MRSQRPGPRNRGENFPLGMTCIMNFMRHNVDLKDIREYSNKCAVVSGVLRQTSRGFDLVENRLKHDIHWHFLLRLFLLHIFRNNSYVHLDVVQIFVV